MAQSTVASSVGLFSLVPLEGERGAPEWGIRSAREGWSRRSLRIRRIFEKNTDQLSMNYPKIVSPDEWLAARKELLAKEKELTRESTYVR